MTRRSSFPGVCCGYEGSWVTASAQLTTNGDPNYGTGNTTDPSGTYGTYYQSTRNTANLTHASTGADISTGWGGGQHATASSAASLQTGHLNAYAAAYTGNSSAQAWGKFYTDFTVTNSTGSDIYLPISWKVEGNPLVGTNSWTAVDSFLIFDIGGGRSSSTGWLTYSVGTFDQSLSLQPANGTPYFNSHFSATHLGGASWLLTDYVDIAPGVSTGSITGYMGLDCRGGSICDYSHTAIFGLGYHPGVSFSYDAPGFMSGGGVPEPATWSMMVLGLGLGGAALRRRRNPVLA